MSRLHRALKTFAPKGPNQRPDLCPGRWKAAFVTNLAAMAKVLATSVRGPQIVRRPRELVKLPSILAMSAFSGS